MKKNIYLFLLLAVLQQGCTERAGSPVLATEQLTTEEVSQAVESLRLALLHPKQEALLALTAPMLSYGHSSGMIENREGFIASLCSGRFKFEELQFSEETIELADRAATVRHTLTGRSADQDKAPAAVNLHVLLVWYKEAGQIRLLARQAVKRQ